MSIKVTLRQKDITNNRKSFYLDFYPAVLNLKTGKKTRREFLGLYTLNKPKSPLDKKHNEEVTKIAESIRNNRQNEFDKPEIYSEEEKLKLEKKERLEKSFLEYFEKQSKKKTLNTYNSWVSAYKYFYNFTNGDLKFKDLSTDFLEDFKEYLLTTKSNKSSKATLSQNSAVSYFNKVKAALKQAYKDRILEEDLNSLVEPIKEEETRKEYLTLEELNILFKGFLFRLKSPIKLFYFSQNKSKGISGTHGLKKFRPFFMS